METVEQLQDTLTWLINSHITSVRKVVSNYLVVDPSGVEMSDLNERRPVIRLKQNAQRSGVDKWIKQLSVNDVTARHMEDAAGIGRLIEETTGISDNMQGQFHTGRRSAQEARQVQANGSNRLIVLGSVIWTEGLAPLGRQMLSNLRDGLDEETYVRVLGQGADPGQFNQFVPVSKEMLVGNYDFELFDGVLPSEKALQAQTLQELLMQLMSNPEVIPLLGYDPKALLREILILKGIRNPERFILMPPGMPAPGQPQPGPDGQPAQPVDNVSMRQMNGAPTMRAPARNGNPNSPKVKLTGGGTMFPSSIASGTIAF